MFVIFGKVYALKEHQHRSQAKCYKGLGYKTLHLSIGSSVSNASPKQLHTTQIHLHYLVF